MSARLVLPYPPSANKLWRPVNGMLVSTAAAQGYKKEVKYLARLAGVQPLGGKLRVTLYVFRVRRHGDLDNAVKILLDSLNGIAYSDDGQICEIHAYRQEDKDNPRVEVEIEQV